MAEINMSPAEKVTVLVVEDDPNLRRLFVEVLRRESYAVQEADCGEAALALLENNSFDIVLSDLQMLKLSGLDVLQAARQKDPSTQVIIITGYASVGTAVRAMRQGAYEYLTKPVQPEALTLKVRNAIERRHLLQTLASQAEALQAHHEMIERDLILAKQVQASLVPSSFANSGIEVGIKYVPMIGLGGDFADVYAASSDKVYLAVIDVTGHGISAALLVSRVCHEWRRQVQRELDPAEMLWQLNEFFISTFYDTPLFLTIMAVECDIKKRTLRYAGSAHPAALLWHGKNQVFSRLDPQNAIIGFARTDLSAFCSTTISYEPGDVLLLYTDGVVEAEDENGKILGLLGMQRIIRRQGMEVPAIAAATGIIDDVVKFTNDKIGDDVLMMFSRLR
jgi:serine phosphatase RsbU (regulator of sigma subunit)